MLSAITKKTVAFSKPNGEFVCFLDYEGEDDFASFLSWLSGRLGTEFAPPTQHPYSATANGEFLGESILAMFHPDTGCCVLCDPGKLELAEAIVARCYGAPHT